MASYPIPAKLNGTQLMQELKDAKIIVDHVRVADDLLWLETEDSKAAAIVAAHIGIDTPPTIEEKLAAAGITLDELKAVLGL